MDQTKFLIPVVPVHDHMQKKGKILVHDQGDLDCWCNLNSLMPFQQMTRKVPCSRMIGVHFAHCPIVKIAVVNWTLWCTHIALTLSFCQTLQWQWVTFCIHCGCPQRPNRRSGCAQPLDTGNPLLHSKCCNFAVFQSLCNQPLSSCECGKKSPSHGLAVHQQSQCPCLQSEWQWHCHQCILANNASSSLKPMQKHPFLHFMNPF